MKCLVLLSTLTFYIAPQHHCMSQCGRLFLHMQYHVFVSNVCILRTQKCIIAHSFADTVQKKTVAYMVAIFEVPDVNVNHYPVIQFTKSSIKQQLLMQNSKFLQWLMAKRLNSHEFFSRRPTVYILLLFCDAAKFFVYARERALSSFAFYDLNRSNTARENNLTSEIRSRRAYLIPSVVGLLV